MYENNRILVVIPARGGSKGIPRKNIRLMNDKPLIAYVIKSAKLSNLVDDVVVTTDDDEIKFISEKYGAEVIKRSGKLAEDNVPLDPVIYDATLKKENQTKSEYDIVITIQPTSPLLKTKTLDKTIEKLKDNDTIISVVDDRHLTWSYSENKGYYPLYKERVNRQYLPKTYKETGSIFASKREFIKENTRMGNKINLIEISPEESIDIDNYEDWWVAERLLKRKKIIIKTDATDEIGTGHIYRGLTIASKLTNHEVLFLIDENKKLGLNIIKNYNFPYITHNNENLIETIKNFNPHIIINDILNTEEEYMEKLKKENYFIINFEDIGKGAKKANIVFDALYEHKIPLKNIYSGHKYYILKDEFYLQPYKKIEKKINNILLTFGGTDPNNLTEKVLNSILKSNYNKNIIIILGLGYKNKKELQKKYSNNPNIQIFENVKNMSEHILTSDIVFTSAGRTMYEICSLAVPCICLCQNKRELTHIFGNIDNGFINLGLGEEISENEIIETLENIINDYNFRLEMNKRMKNIDIKHGFENIIEITKIKYKEFEKGEKIQ